MSEILEMHPARIKPRDIARIVETLRHGGVVIAPSDSGYALLCQLDDKSAAEKIRHIRELERDHPFTILCADLTDLARYARVDNVQFRLLKTLFPGAYTCILPASREVPRRVQNDKRKTIGIRVPDHPVLQAIQVALMVDAGDVPLRPTTVLDLTEMPPLLLRQGAGEVTGIV